MTEKYVINLPPSAAGARHLHALVRRGTGCGCGSAAAQGSRAAAAVTGAGTDLRAAERDPRRRRTGASRLRRRGECLRPPLAPSLRAEEGPRPPRRRLGGQTLGSHGDAPRWRGGGRGPPRAHAVSRGFSPAFTVPLGTPAPAASAPGRGPVRAPPGLPWADRTKSSFRRGSVPSGRRELPPMLAPGSERTSAGA